jgi:hypothetical protein
MIDFSTPLAGMNAAAATVNAAATRLAAPTTMPQMDEPTSDIVSLSVGELYYANNAMSAKVRADIAQVLIDIMG